MLRWLRKWVERGIANPAPDMMLTCFLSMLEVRAPRAGQTINDCDPKTISIITNIQKSLEDLKQRCATISSLQEGDGMWIEAYLLERLLVLVEPKDLTDTKLTSPAGSRNTPASAGRQQPKRRRRSKPVCRTIPAELRTRLGRSRPAHRTQALAAEWQRERPPYMGRGDSVPPHKGARGIQRDRAGCGHPLK